MPSNIASDWSEGVMRTADQFVAQVASIAEINSTVIPEMEREEKGRFRTPTREIDEYLSPEEKIAFAEGAREFAEGLAKVAEMAERGETNAEVNLQLHGSAGAVIAHMVTHGTRFMNADPQHQLLRNALLVSSVSSFEILFGRVARAILDINRAAFTESDHGFTLQQLFEFNSLEDAREFLIERQVSKLLYESVDGWDKWLKRASGGLSMSELPIDWTVVREGFARRNLLVHSDGVVNQIYLGILKKLDGRRDWGAKAGEKIGVSGEYLTEFLEELMALGRMLCVGVGVRMRKQDERIFLLALLGDIRRNLMAGHWRSVRHTAEYALKYNLPRSDQISAQVSAWVARKSLLGVDEIRGEVEGWDTTGLVAKFAHQKSVLLNETDAAVAEINKLIAEGVLTTFEVAVEPIYSEVREFVLNPSFDSNSCRGSENDE
ncbi:hypothetical protein AB0M38_03360 [Streptomyces sp. NPDC051742]|uniref:hypothetical protein n=1 Tax=unclassified Streptomyces TaxID=2593676 RepID=UPI00342CD1CF